MVLYSVGIADHAAQKDLRCAGKIRQALGDEAAGAALGGGEGQMPVPAEAEHRLLQPGNVFAVEIAAQPPPHLRQQRGHPGLAGRFIIGPGGQVQRHLAGQGKGRQCQVVLLMEQVGQQLLHLRLRQAEDPQVVGADHLSVALLQIGQQTVLRQIPALRGNAGQQHGGDAAGGKGAAGGGTHRVVEHGAARRQIGLLQVAGGHLPVEHGVEVALYLLRHLRVEHQGRVQRGGHRCFRHVVIGGAEAAGEHQQLRAVPGGVDGGLQPGSIVAHGGVVQHVHTGGGQQLRQEPGIGIGDAAGQQLAAHGDDLRSTGHGIRLLRTGA